MAKATIIRLTDSTKELLGLMHFAAIPEEANYVAFEEDGLATFFETLDVSPGWVAPQMTFVTYLVAEDFTVQ